MCDDKHFKMKDICLRKCFEALLGDNASLFLGT